MEGVATTVLPVLLGYREIGLNAAFVQVWRNVDLHACLFWELRAFRITAGNQDTAIRKELWDRGQTSYDRPR